MESIIKTIFFRHLISNNLIHDSQCRFLPNRSCLTSLLEVLDFWTLSVDRGLPVDVLYIDYEKDFDQVQHNLLMDKLEAIGVKGKLLYWFESYLSNRKQRVKLENSISDWRAVHSGIPQGSVLGPIFFLVYTYDTPSNSMYIMFKLKNFTL